VDTDSTYLLLETDRDGTVTASGKQSFTISKGMNPDDPPSGNQPGAMGRSSWLWDGSRLVAHTSDTGLVPLYYYRDQSRFAISPSLLTLRDRFGNHDLDWTALAIQLGTGHFIEGDTPFLDIKALQVCSTLTWTSGVLTERRRPFEIPALDMDYRSALSEFGKTFRRAVERTLPSQAFTLGLSGGHDSRHILFHLADIGYRPEYVVSSSHYLAASDPDTAIAAKVAERVGVPLETVSPNLSRITAELDKNLRTESLSLSHSWILEMSDKIADVPVLYDGMTGGTLFGRTMMVRSIRKSYGSRLPPISELAEAVMRLRFDSRLRRNREILVENLFDDQHMLAARQRVRTLITSFGHAPNPAQAFQHFHHAQRETATAPYRLMRNALVLCPLQDPEVVRFALGLPWAVTADDRFQRDALNLEYPQHADIPFTDDLPHHSTSEHWNRDVEARDAIAMTESMIAGADTIVTADAIDLLHSGRMGLEQIQVASYMLQLIAWNDDNCQRDPRDATRRDLRSNSQ